MHVTYLQEIEDWRATRLRKLTGEDGWTTLVGLFWLKPGENRFGRNPDNDVALDYAALSGHAGTFSLHGEQLTFRAAPGSGISHRGRPVSTLILSSDLQGSPTVLEFGTLRFYAHESAGRIGIRFKDSAADARVHFKGLEYYPIDPAWRFEARFETYRPMRQISVINVLGMEEQMDSPGALLFEIEGHGYRLDTILERGETDYFVMFADRSNGKQTYGAGRFLYVQPPVDGVTVLDFNKAYNPPCVFSNFATCPLPPPQNRLPIVISAGELKYAGGTH